MAQGHVIMLYGPMAAGKLTVATLLSKELGYRLSHNHLINDLCWSIYDRGVLGGEQFIEDLRFRFYEEVARAGVRMVTTHAYAHDFVSQTGLSDPEYMRRLEDLFETHGTRVDFVHLKARHEKLLERIDAPSRFAFKKLTDRETMRTHLMAKDFDTSAPVTHNLVVDTSDLTAEETARFILTSLHHVTVQTREPERS